MQEVVRSIVCLLDTDVARIGLLAPVRMKPSRPVASVGMVSTNFNHLTID